MPVAVLAGFPEFDGDAFDAVFVRALVGVAVQIPPDGAGDGGFHDGDASRERDRVQPFALGVPVGSDPQVVPVIHLVARRGEGDGALGCGEFHAGAVDGLALHADRGDLAFLRVGELAP